MESAVRYDFSFPPKSSSWNNNANNLHQTSTAVVNHGGSNTSANHGQMHTIYNRHTSRSHHYIHNNNQPPPLPPSHQQANNYQQQQQPQQQNGHFGTGNSTSVGLSKSASTSLLSCVMHNNNNNNNINNNNNNNNNNNGSKTGGNSYCNSCHKECHSSSSSNSIVSNTKSARGKSSSSQFTILASSNVMNQHQHASNAPPHTPKDENCSFTFDDFKSTLSFMDDSPLVNTNSNNSNNNNVNHVNVNPSTTSVLMVIPTSQPSNDSASSHSASSTSSSSASCNRLSTGSSSCNSYCGPTATHYLPKSNSNPMLMSSSSTLSSSSSATGLSTSPVSMGNTFQNQQHIKSECACVTTQLPPHKHQQNDLIDKKSPPADKEHQHQQNVHTNSTKTVLHNTTSLIQPANNIMHMPAQMNGGINTAIESAAKKYRCAAQISEATCCWKGKLPPKQYKTPIVYSTKVFVGGLPWDITEEDLVKEFGVFGPCRVEWTNKEKYNLLSSGIQHQSSDSSFDTPPSTNGQSFRSNRSIGNLQHYNNSNNNKQQSNSSNNNNSQQNSDSMNSSKQRLTPGFAYVIYDNEYSIRSLVGNCIEDYQNGRDRVEYYFKISTRRVRNKEVQIIPWILADNNFALCTPKELDPKKTVFVGNLHGTMTARDLAHIMNELFGCVVYAGIDIDKLKYPIGSGRVTFSLQQNFMRAVRAAFFDIQSSKFSKRIQIDPYLEDVECCLCYMDKGIYFCRDFQCFDYYCGLCWDKQHSFNQLGNHKPLMRKREDK